MWGRYQSACLGRRTVCILSPLSVFQSRKLVLFTCVMAFPTMFCDLGLLALKCDWFNRSRSSGDCPVCVCVHGCGEGQLCFFNICTDMLMCQTFSCATHTQPHCCQSSPAPDVDSVSLRNRFLTYSGSTVTYGKKSGVFYLVT